MAIEIVDLPIQNGGSFHSCLYVYQRVYYLYNWLVVELYPSEKWWSQLGWWNSQYMEKQNMFQTTNQNIYLERCFTP